MSDLERRIEKLERQARSWRRFGLASMAMLIVAAFVAAEPKVPRHEELEVGTLTVGQPEGARIRMTTQPDGAYLILYDENGKQRWRVAAKSRDPYWNLHDAEGRVVRRLP